MTSPAGSAAPASAAASICLDCRLVVGEGQRCPGGARHRVTSLATQEGRERLRDEVWGPAHLRRKAKEAAIAGGTGGASGSVLDGCGVPDCCGGVDDIGILIVFFACALVAVLLYWLVKYLVGLYREHKHRPRPKGAWANPGLPAGRVWAGRLLPSPSATPGAPLARGLRLECERFLGSAVMLRDGTCQELTVELEDGSRVRLPAGRLRIEAARPLEHGLSTAAVAEYLRGVDPLRPVDSEEHDPVPCEHATEVTLQAGDRIALYGELDWEADPQQPGGGYRSPAAKIGFPRGPFVLRLVSCA